MAAWAARLLADAILLLHAGFIAFVVLGLVAILIGGARGWRWVRIAWFRLAHLAAIGVVVAQAWLGVACPLTRWESELRRAAGQPGYEQGFIADWLHALIFFDLPLWVFTLAYSLFALLVLVSLALVPPRWPRRRARSLSARS